MPEAYEITAARKITALERKLGDQAVGENGYTMGDVIGTILAFPELRAFWPFSSVDESGNVRDIGGQGRTLTNNGTTPRAVLNNIIPYATMDGATQFFSRADEAGLRITGALTLGGWFKSTNNAAAHNLMTKFTSLAVGNRAYLINQQATGEPQLAVSASGAAFVNVLGPAATCAINTWYFMAGRFTPSTELAVFVNEGKWTNLVGVPAAIFAGNAPFNIGAQNGRPDHVGSAALCFLCASAVPDSLLMRFHEVCRGFFGV